MFVQRFKGSLYILAAVVSWYFVRSTAEWVVARRFFAIPNFVFEMGDLFYHLIGLLAGIGVFLGLFLNQKSKVFIDEVAVETSKVSWPTWKDTVNATIVVSIAIIIAGFAFGAMDWFIGWTFKWSFEQLLKG